MMADMYTQLSVSRSYLYNIARAADKGIVSNKVNKKSYPNLFQLG